MTSGQHLITASAYESLKTEFYKAFDPSYLDQAVEKLNLGHTLTGFSQIGEGADFAAWRTEHGGFPFAIKIAHGEFSRSESRGAFVRAMAKLKNLRAPLIPPVEVLDRSYALAYVLPFGESRSTDWGISWQACCKALQEKGLKLADIPQVRFFKDTPFIIDWSDLTLF